MSIGCSASVVCAAVVLKTPGSASAEALRAHCRERLAGFKVPRQVEFLDELPKTGTGKILKRALREPYWADSGRSI